MKGTGESRLWRCLEELTDARALQALVGEELPGDGWGSPGTLTRRRFMTVMGASLALGAAAGCGRPAPREIVPYVRAPEEVVPGKPLYFATAMPVGGVATGLLVEQHLGRPTKVEGNPDHPASRGATDTFAQASVLSLYDPDRSRTVIHEGRPSARPRAVASLQAALAPQRAKRGAGLRVLSEATTSPTLARQMELLLTDFPEARWHQYEPIGQSQAREGARRAFGEVADVVYRLDKANVILALDSDFLTSGPGCLRYAGDFANQRRVWPVRPEQARMSRLYSVGPTPSSTSAVADHHLPTRGTDVASFARALAQRLGVKVGPGSESGLPETWLAALAKDLGANRGTGLVLAGEQQPPFVHALAHALNDALGNAGRTVDYIAPVHARPADAAGSLRELAEEMRKGRVEVLVILGANPAYTAPADLDFPRHLGRVPYRLHLGLYRDETAALCHWHLPEAHYLESWGDARAYDGTVSILQPLIRPLTGGLTGLELVAAMRGRPDYAARSLVREHWREQWKGRVEGFERLWGHALHDGVVKGTTSEPLQLKLKPDWWKEDTNDSGVVPQRPLELVFRPDAAVHDGRFANNAWLQELPGPLTRITWDNVALIGPETARELGLRQEMGSHGGDVLTDVVELRYSGRSVEAPVWVMPGHAEGSVTAHLGYGRTAAGRVGSHVGFSAYRLRRSDRPWFDSGLEVRKTGRRHRIATTQLHHVMQGRDPVRTGTLDQYRKRPGSIAARRALPVVGEEHPPPSLHPEHEYRRYKWGMVIDLTVCTGCSACVIACQAENNIPVVGKDEVARGREMHWLRVDMYHTGEASSPRTYFQPVPCMHCEKAPCEVVCPVNATVHSDEGLNDMTYNRCVGTRYCSSNCPYKVRRFNFFEYADHASEGLKALRNPDVTVRSRGVMEKCTYCVQRINRARIHAEKDDRPLVRNRAGELIKPIYAGELLTACQAACPTQAIAFGDLNDPAAEVVRRRERQPLHYGLLSELGTQPRTTYLAVLRNPSPQLGDG